MDSGKIENWLNIQELVLMSVGTDKGTWWADTSFGSELWTLRRGKIAEQTADTLNRMILESLKWLKDEKLAKEITCISKQTGKNTIAYSVTVFHPDGNNTIIIEDIWNGN